MPNPLNLLLGATPNHCTDATFTSTPAVGYTADSLAKAGPGELGEFMRTVTGAPGNSFIEIDLGAARNLSSLQVVSTSVLPDGTWRVRASDTDDFVDYLGVNLDGDDLANTTAATPFWSNIPFSPWSNSAYAAYSVLNPGERWAGTFITPAGDWIRAGDRLQYFPVLCRAVDGDSLLVIEARESGALLVEGPERHIPALTTTAAPVPATFETTRVVALEWGFSTPTTKQGSNIEVGLRNEGDYPIEVYAMRWHPEAVSTERGDWDSGWLNAGIPSSDDAQRYQTGVGVDGRTLTLPFVSGDGLTVESKAYRYWRIDFRNPSYLNNYLQASAVVGGGGFSYHSAVGSLTLTDTTDYKETHGNVFPGSYGRVVKETELTVLVSRADRFGDLWNMSAGPVRLVSPVSVISMPGACELGTGAMEPGEIQERSFYGVQVANSVTFVEPGPVLGEIVTAKMRFREIK